MCSSDLERGAAEETPERELRPALRHPGGAQGPAGGEDQPGGRGEGPGDQVSGGTAQGAS